MITINVDKNFSTKEFDKYASDDALLVTSIFYTIQGEGPWAGQPAVFLRLAGCNIGAKVDCPWCDTAFQVDRAQVMPVETVLELIFARSRGASLVVVTGGEPLLQWKGMRRLFARNATSRFTWQFETNGYLLKEDTLQEAADVCHDDNINVRFVISPKVPTNLGHYRAIPLAWKGNNDFTIAALKYVVCSNPGNAYSTPGPTIKGIPTYLSGMTVYRRACEPGEVANVWDDTLVDREATATNYRYAAALVMENPLQYRLSLQTHLFAAVE